MSAPVEIAVVGDLMMECMHSDSSGSNRTLVVDRGGLPLGGSAINVCWHLAHLGRKPSLIGVHGENEMALASVLFGDLPVNKDGLISQPGPSDLLASFVNPTGHRSIYIHSAVTPDTVEKLTRHMQGRGCLIVNGSRQATMRAVAAAVVTADRPRFRAFSPSYTLYSYSRDEFETMITVCDATFLNEQETAHACELIGVPDAAGISLRTRKLLVCTYGDKGAVVWQDGNDAEIPSVSGIEGDVVGAGDAFLSGFVHQLLNGASPRDAGLYGAGLASIIVKARDPRPPSSGAHVNKELHAWQGVT